MICDDILQKLTILRNQKYSHLDKSIFDDMGIISNNNLKINKIICGIDLGFKEIYLMEQMKYNLDSCLFISHHPIGHYAEKIPEAMNFYKEFLFKNQNIFKLIDQDIAYNKRLYINDNILRESQIFKIKKLNCICVHTLSDMLAYDFLIDYTKGEHKLSNIIQKLEKLSELKDSNIKVCSYKDHEDVCDVFPIVSGGCIFSPELLKYTQFDTMILPGYSRDFEFFGRKYNKNLIFVNHMALDSLGMNLMLHELNLKCDFPLSGFTYIER